MKKTIINTAMLFLACSVGYLPAAKAALKVKPGTWEMTVKMTGLPFPMPPTKVSYCIDKKNPVPKSARQEKDCKFTWKTSGNTVNWEMHCKSGGTGNAQITYNWDRMHGHQELHTGGGRVMRSTMEGRWVSTSCRK